MSRHTGMFDDLSVVAGAAQKHDAKERTLRASLKGSMNASTGGDQSPRMRPQTADASRPKLVQGDYTFHTARRNLTISSQQLGRELLPGEAAAAAGAPLAMPAMRPVSASANSTNMAAWKAYGSPAARGQPRPAPLPTPSHVNTNPHMFSSVASKAPRAQALGGGFRLQRPHSAPSGPPAHTEHHYQHHHLAHTHYQNQPGSPSSPSACGTRSPSAAANGSGSLPPRHPGSPLRRQAGRAGYSPTATSTVHNSAVLGVEMPDPLGGGKTDGGKVMFEYTLPTDPYGKFLWEEQARKARSSMSRHQAAMAAAASMNGGAAAACGGGGGGVVGGGGGSRPGSARRAGGGGGGGAPLMSSLSTGALAAGGGGPGMRLRFSSSAISSLQRQGSDHRPPTVVGFAAPNMAEDTTLPGPGDPRWAYTRLGRTQIDRLQQALKMPDPALASRPTSAPMHALGGRSGGGGGGGGGGPSPERTGGTAAAHGSGWGITGMAGVMGLSSVSELQDEGEGAAFAGVGGSSGRGRFGSAAAAAGLEVGHSPRFGPGEAPPLPPRRPNSSDARVNVSGAATVAAQASVAAAVTAVGEMPGGGGVRGVRGSSAGRGRELAPNPRVDLREYLAEERAEAEAQGGGSDADADTEILPEDGEGAAGYVSAGYDNGGYGEAAEGCGGEAAAAEVFAASEEEAAAAAAVEALQSASVPVPADDLAAKLAAVAAAREESREVEEEGEGDQRRTASHAGDGAMMAGVAAAAGGSDEGAVVMQHGGGAEEEFGGRGGGGGSSGGDDALLALHGTGRYAGRGGRYGSGAADAYGKYGEEEREGQVPASAEDQDEQEQWQEGPPDGYGDAFVEGTAVASGGGGRGQAVMHGEGDVAGGRGDQEADVDEGEGVAEDDGADEEADEEALAQLPLERAGSFGSRRTPSGHLRPTSAHPTSARPTSARPISGRPGSSGAMQMGSPSRGSSGRHLRASGDGDGGGGGGGVYDMDVIHEHSEDTVGEEC